MKIVTWNVNGIRARAAQLAELIQLHSPDVICLQEIKAKPDQVPILFCGLDDYWSYWHGGGGYSGVSLHIRKTFASDPPHFSHPEFDFENRIVTAQIGHLTVASIYVPNGGKDFTAKTRFLRALSAFAQTFLAIQSPLILCGDLNVARLEMDVHPKERNPRSTGQTPEERAWFEELLKDGMVDIGRTLDPENDGLFTWWAPWRNMKARNIGWRLDYILADTMSAKTARVSLVEVAFGTSDHAPVIVSFGEDSNSM